MCRMRAVDEADITALTAPPAWSSRLTIDEYRAFVADRWTCMHVRAIFNRVAWSVREWPAPLRFDA